MADIEWIPTGDLKQISFILSLEVELHLPTAATQVSPNTRDGIKRYNEVQALTLRAAEEDYYIQPLARKSCPPFVATI